MAILSSQYRCIILKGLEQQALDNPDLIKRKRSGFSIDTNSLLFFYKDELCKMMGRDVGATTPELDLGEIGHLKNDNSVTIAGTNRLWNFKGYLTVFAGSTAQFIFEPFKDAKYEIIPTKLTVAEPPPEHKRPWWHP